MKASFEKRKEIHTARLDLRPSKDDRDLEIYVSHLKEEDCFLYQYGEDYSEELEEAISFDSGYVIYYSIFLKDTDIMVGYIGILPLEDGERSGDLEFHVYKEFRQNGFGYEAATAILDRFVSGELAGEKPNLLTATIIHGNLASASLLEKLDFTKVASGFRVYYDHGEQKTVGICAYEKRFMSAG